ncbi:MAG TPA: hypothetical protein PK680_06130 [Novosphingobium sp.]|nr:hypothetical protein [Novosphingobium sp.]HQA17945.1 hypothetical protein [Novosphingobium sp.]
MRKLPFLFAATLAGLGLAVPGLAQAQDLTTASQRLELAAVAPVACVISTPSVTNQSNASYASTGSASGQVSITELVDGDDATSRASSIELNLPVVCNASHRVRISSANGGLLRAGGSAAGRSGGFQEFLAYQVGIDWAGQSAQLQTTSRDTSIDANQPGKGEMVIRIATPAGGGPLIAGQYSDSIVVEVQPAS